jgi:hypothetical protein
VDIDLSYRLPVEFLTRGAAEDFKAGSLLFHYVDTMLIPMLRVDMDEAYGSVTCLMNLVNILEWEAGTIWPVKELRLDAYGLLGVSAAGIPAPDLTCQQAYGWEQPKPGSLVCLQGGEWQIAGQALVQGSHSYIHYLSAQTCTETLWPKPDGGMAFTSWSIRYRLSDDLTLVVPVEVTTTPGA